MLQRICMGCMFLVVACAVAAAEPTYTVSYTATFSADELQFSQQLGYDVVRLGDAHFVQEAGHPQLPVRTLRIAVPADMQVTGLTVVGTEVEPVAGTYNVFPAQPPAPMSEPATPEGFTAPDATIYGSAQAYPAQAAVLTLESDLAGQPFAVVDFYPVRYTPTTGELQLLSSIEIELQGEPGYVCGDYLPRSISDRGRASYEQRVNELVANPEAAQAVAAPASALAGARGVDPSENYDYVIITQGSWEDDFQPLADWKTKKGVPAKVVTTNWIYTSGGYSGNSLEMVRAFIIDAANNWGTTYFLLGGDTNVVPTESRPMENPNTGYDDYIPNDTYYADYDGDWTVELHVGRASVRTVAAINTFINKVLTYEKNPPLTDYTMVAAFFGFDLQSYGSGEGEGCKSDIDSLYIPGTWTVNTEYDSEPGTHKSDVIGYLNQGANLVNHFDHTDTYVMGAGGTNHGDYLSVGNMSSLYNGDRQCIMYSVGCWAGNYAATTCIAEAFVQNPNGGGVAYVGNSRYGWYVPYAHDGLSARYDRYFFRSIFDQNHRHLGDAFTDSKNDAYAAGDTMRYIFVELTLLGDPELPIWVATPNAFSSVTHPTTIDAGTATAFPVHVEFNSLPIYGATVCLWKDGEIYETGTTNTSGDCTFNITVPTLGDLYVTVSREYYLPYEGTCYVDGPPLPEACCLANQDCVMLSPPDCVAQGGISQGSGVTCDGLYCPPPPDPRTVDVTLVPSINPDNVCPGDTFTVDVMCASQEGDLQDIRLLQFDASLSSNLTITDVTFNLPISGNFLYLFNTINPAATVQAAYTEGYRVAGYIVDFLDETPQLMATYTVTYTGGGTAELNLAGEATAPVDEGMRFRAGFDPMREYGLAEGNVSGGVLTLNEGSCQEIHIVSSDPGDGWIDARVPIDPSTLEAQGWTSLQLTFDGSPAGLAPSNFAVAETCVAGNCDGVAPSVVAVLPVAGNVLLVGLDRPIDPKAWTTITYVDGDANDRVRLGFLPADADESGTANTFDVLSLIDLINDALGGGSPPSRSTDIDRSGSITLTDLLVLIDLLNGATPYEPYLGVQLPTIP